MFNKFIKTGENWGKGWVGNCASVNTSLTIHEFKLARGRDFVSDFHHKFVPGCKIEGVDAKVKAKVDKLFAQEREQKFKKGEVLAEPEREPRGVYYLTEGVVRQYSTSARGEEFVINTFRAPSFLPLAWVFNDEIPTHYFEATEVVIARSITKEKFLKFLENNPVVLFDLVKRIYHGLQGYTLRLESMMTGDAYSRLVVELLINAKRFGKNLSLTQDDLAAQSGIARETVSRELKKLKEKKLVRVKNHVLSIPDIKILEAELSSL